MFTSVAATARGAAPPDADWTAFGHDAHLTNYTPARLTAKAARTLHLAWARRLDGSLVAAPLAATARGGKPRVYYATEAGSVYALDAATGAIVWQRRLGAVDTIACGSFGISSTGAIDVSRRILYVANADGYVYGLSLANGADVAGWPVRVTARPRTEYVWGGLRIVAGRLVVPLASYCDASDAERVPAEGGLLSLDLHEPHAQPLVFDPAPGFANAAGIWGWGGVAVGMHGNLFTGVGNSEPEPHESQGYAEALVQLSPSLEVLSFNRPYVPSAAEDTDLGGAPVLFQPRGCPALAALNGKAGALYVWRRNQLAAGPYLSLPLSDGTTAFVGEPAWSPRTQTLYDAGATFFFGGRRLGDGLIAVRFRRGCSVRKVWSAVVGGAFQPPPLVAGDVVVAAGGRSGGLEAHAAANGVRLWRFPTMAATLEPPIEARGVVFAGDSAGNAYAFRARR